MKEKISWILKGVQVITLIIACFYTVLVAFFGYGTPEDEPTFTNNLITIAIIGGIAAVTWLTDQIFFEEDTHSVN